MIDLSLVICTLDEAEAIGAVLRELDEQLANIATEVIVVDDSRNDATAIAVGAFTPAHIQVRLLRRPDAQGLASAAAAGWALARGRILGLMDGDGQHDPAVLPELMRLLDSQCGDIAVASRYIPGARTGLSGYRQALSVSGTALAKGVTGVATSDPMSGLFVFTRLWWERAQAQLKPLGYKILLELALSGGAPPRIVEAPTMLRGRLGGVSKLDGRVIADLAAQLIDKCTGGFITARFALFGGVEASGVVLNVIILTSFIRFGASFWVAQIMSVLAAMTSNFLFNNLLTFRDHRLSGAALWSGLLGFYIACAAGAIINETVGLGLHSFGVTPVIDAIAGAIASAVWNYSSASVMSWRMAINLRKRDCSSRFAIDMNAIHSTARLKPTL